ncbi:MAG: branched-chain amino acid ABC transporter permease [Desulfosudaceae bacterium]
MTEFLQMISGGIAVGSTYALMGLGMVLIYKASEVPNFVQGEMALLPVFVAYLIMNSFGLPVYAAFAGALLFSLFLGCFLEFAVLRRAKEPNVLGLIIITIGLEMVLLGLVSWKFGADQRTMDFPITAYDSIMVGDFYISTLNLITLISALVIMIALFLFFRFSRFGVAMKATQQNETAARLMGIKTNRVKMVTWGISSFVGTVAGLLLSPIIMEPYMMWDPMLKGFAGAVVGGMTSLPGAVFGAYLVGIVEHLFGGYVSIEFKSVVAFVVIVLVLCVKPSGLFARHYIKKV